MSAHRISTTPSESHVRVEANGQVLAESDRAVELHETGLPTRYYLPREDVRMELLTPTDTTSHCPFKGDASYFSLKGGPQNAVWSYERPFDEMAAIRDYLAFYPDKLEIVAG